MIKDFKLLEHNLIPLALFILNISVIHLIYLLFIESKINSHALFVLVCTGILIAGIRMKNKFLIIPALFVYLAVFIKALN